jgi:hypothetical protein
VLSLANQIGDHPVLLTDLKIFQSKSNQFGTSQAASNEQRQNGSITLSSQAVSLLFREQGSCASRLTAAKRTLIVEGARFFCSRKNRLF